MVLEAKTLYISLSSHHFGVYIICVKKNKSQWAPPKDSGAHINNIQYVYYTCVCISNEKERGPNQSETIIVDF